TYWTGGISSWGIASVKKGHTVATLTTSYGITYGSTSNAYDLSKYQVFVICEPQNPFTAAQKKAIFDFVRNGGGLFIVADHYGSDRDNDGWDAPRVLNDLGIQDSFGMHFAVSGEANNNISETSSSHSSGDSIISGLYGTASSLKFDAGSCMTLYTAKNSTVKAHFWRSSSSTAVMCASARFGKGKVVGIGDSSPADDGTGQSGNTLYYGWTSATDATVFMNGTLWLAAASSGGDVTPPVITAGPAVGSITASSAAITWTTDEASNSKVEYGTTASYGLSLSNASYVTGHSLALSGLAASTTYHYRVASTDASGNGPTYSADKTFTTPAAADVTPPVITAGPTVSSITASGATIAWTTDEAANSKVDYGTTTSYGSTASDANYVTSHSLTLSGLAAGTTYHFRVGSTDAAGNGPTYSGDATFTTAAAQGGPAVVINEVNEQNGSTPGYNNEYVELYNTTSAAISLSGWTLKQYSSAYTTTFASGASIPAYGYYVVVRSSAGSWSSYYGTAYNVVGSMVLNGGQTFALHNSGGTLVDSTIKFATPYYCQYRAPGSTGTLAASWSGDAKNGTAATYGTPGAANPSAKGGAVIIDQAQPAPQPALAFGNTPNPFRGSTAIHYQVAKPGNVTLTVYNIAGQRVCTLVDGYQAAGSHNAAWDGRDGSGVRAAEGVFIYRLSTAGGSATGRMSLIK
ncbi:MAG TPA: lamin tail domain-containing protein, partial [Candidatus Edwardsbacteria bacterium]|nr:lamin tail domain-containing protein [Candidatus Edwardsbacteria bacterium]